MQIVLNPKQYGKGFKQGPFWSIVHYILGVHMVYFYVEVPGRENGKELITSQQTKLPPTLTAVTKEQFKEWNKVKQYITWKVKE